MCYIWVIIVYKIGVLKDVILLVFGYEFGCKIISIYIDYDMEKVDKVNW